MRKRILSILTAMLLLVCLPVSALAHPIPEEGRTGSICVTVRYNDQPISGGKLTLFQVGEITVDGGKYAFSPTGDFANWGTDFGDIQSSDLASSLAAFIQTQKLVGLEKTIGENGSVTFSGLEQGLYLLVQNTAASGYSKLSPFLVSLPYLDGDEYLYDVAASAKGELEREPEPTKTAQGSTSSGKKLPQTGQLWWPVPILISGGLLCIAIGLVLRRRVENEE